MMIPTLSSLSGASPKGSAADLLGLASFFGGPRAPGKRSLQEVAKHLTEEIQAVQKRVGRSPLRSADFEEGGRARHLLEEVQHNLPAIIALIRHLTADEGDSGTSPRSACPDDEAAAALLEGLVQVDIPVQLLSRLPELDFEVRKDAMNFCCALLWPGLPHAIDQQVVEYLGKHPEVFGVLVSGYGNEEVALNCGVVLRSCARHEVLARAFFESGKVHDLLRHARSPSIDISADAFFTLRTLLLEQRDTAAAWLCSHFHEFFSAYNILLEGGEYVTARLSQKLLSDMFLDKHFPNVMVSYVSDEKNLAINMNLLRDKSKTIPLEAFQVFRIFVANPNKPAKVHQILYKNRDRLLTVLGRLRAAKPNDKKFEEEARNTVERLKNLSSPAGSLASSPRVQPSISGRTRSATLAPAAAVSATTPGCLVNQVQPFITRSATEPVLGARPRSCSQALRPLRGDVDSEIDSDGGAMGSMRTGSDGGAMGSMRTDESYAAISL